LAPAPGSLTGRRAIATIAQEMHETSNIRTRVRDRLRALLGGLGLQLRRLPRPLAGRRDALLELRLEHVIAHHLLRRRPEEFFFVQVGAFDGIENDPIHELIVRFKWRGILLEPQADAFQALAANYRDQEQLVLVNAAIDHQPGQRTLYTIRRGEPGLPDWAAQTASFRRQTLLTHRDVIPNIEELVEAESVRCVTFAELPIPGPGAIDLLHIDAEGSDFEVIRAFHESGRTAHIIAFEHKHLARREHAECVAYLIERGYAVGLDGGDSIACLRA
jgi:FkbM family methyltransferase